MSQFQFSNNPSTVLSGAITSGATSISVASGTTFPAAGKFTIIVDSEIMLVTGVAGTTWTVTRGYDGTAAAAHNNNATVTGVLTRASFLSAHAHDVRSYGAKGDGATDDTATIQAAINDAASSGGTVFFPPGTYRVGSALTVLSGQKLIGQGASSILRRATGNNASVISGADDAVDVHISDLAIEGNRAGTSGSTQLIFARRPARWRLDRLKITDGPALAPAILFAGGTDNVISACHFANIGYGVFLGLDANSTDDLDRNVVKGCTGTNIDLNAVFVTGSIASLVSTADPKNNAIIGNTFSACGDATIESGIGCQGTVISGNTLTGGATSVTGILVRDNIGAVVTGNYCANFDGANGDGIAVVSQHTESTDIVIGPNVSRGNTRHGLHIQDAFRVSVNGGEYADNGTHGVFVSAVHYFTLSGLFSARNNAAGIMLTASTNGTVIGCHAIDNSFTTANSADGIATTDAGTTGIVITGCQAYDTRAGGARTQRWGINLFQGSDITLGGGNRVVNNVTGNVQILTTTTKGLTVDTSASATTPGSVVKKIEVFSADGASLGFVPVYNSIT